MFSVLDACRRILLPMRHLETEVHCMPKLTNSVVESVIPQLKDIIVHDDEIRGFSVKITPRGKRVFSYWYRNAAHVQRRYKIGDYCTAMRTEQARTIAKQLSARVSLGEDPSFARQHARKREGQDTVQQWFETYKAAKAHLRSIGEVTRIFNSDILPSLGSRRIDDIGRSDVNQLLDKIGKRSTSMAGGVRRVLSAFYSWAMPWLPDSFAHPVKNAVSVALPVARARFLSIEELQELWAALEHEKEPWRSALRMLILTGQRRGEVFGADWSEFDLTSQTWTIPAERCKNDRAHIVPLTCEVLSILGNGFKSGPVFPGGDHRGFSRAARRIRANVSFTDWTWHDLRRSFATGLQRLGVKLEVTEAILNHSSGTRAGIVGVYQRYDWMPERRVALSLWSTEVMQNLVRSS